MYIETYYRNHFSLYKVIKSKDKLFINETVFNINNDYMQYASVI